MGYGLLDEGRSPADGREVRSPIPRDAQALGIGMVYQHFTLATGDDGGREPVLARGRRARRIDWKRNVRNSTAFMKRMPFSCRSKRPSPGFRPASGRSCEILKQLYLRGAF
jgi:ABC-type uncharacterized transport system ATPase subunit